MLFSRRASPDYYARIFDMCASERLLVTGMHLHFPGFSHLARRRSTYELVPEVWKLKGTAQPDPRLRGATIWVADDPLRTLLRIRSEVFVGAVTLDLVKVDG